MKRLARRILRAAGRQALSAADWVLDTYYHPRHAMDETAIKRAAEHVARARRVLVCAGSGLSAESGVPTFRGKDGMFRDPAIARMTQVDTFETDRQAMMRWYQARRDKLDTIEPNPGHLALIELANLANYTFATQNVDHLLEAAAGEVGYRPPIHHLHGSLLEVLCNDCGNSFEDLTLDLGALPPCEVCGGPLRPGVVWFGESLPEEALRASAEAARRCDVCLVVGTSGLVHPAAALPETARQFGAVLIEINPNSSALSDICQILIREKAGKALPTLLDEVRKLVDSK